MNIISENFFLFLLIFLVIISSSAYSFINFKKLKETEKKRLEILLLEIEREKTIQKSLNPNILKINGLEKETKVLFTRINVKILNLTFSYKEVLSKI